MLKLLLGLILAAVAFGAAHALPDDPVCSNYRRNWDTARSGNVQATIEGAAGIVPGPCHKLKLDTDFFLAGLHSQTAYEVSVCNKTGGAVWVAYFYQPVNDTSVWHGSGWFKFNDQECAPAFVTSNSSFALHAEGDGGKKWGTAARYCLNPKDAYTFDEPASGDTSTCPQGTQTAMFDKFTTTSSGYTVTYNPQ